MPEHNVQIMIIIIALYFNPNDSSEINAIKYNVCLAHQAYRKHPKHANEQNRQKLLDNSVIAKHLCPQSTKLPDVNESTRNSNVELVAIKCGSW